MPDNLKDKFLEIAGKYPQRVALQCKRNDKWTTCSYGELFGYARCVSKQLSQKNFRKAEKVALILPAAIEWPIVFFGMMFLGGVVVPINPEAEEKEIKAILHDAQCRFVFVSDEGMAETIARLRCPFVSEIIIARYGQWFGRGFGSDIEISFAPSLNYDDLACLLYTSGTTDDPKGVMLSHGNLASNVEGLQKRKLISCRDSLFSFLPLHHAYPLTGTLLFPLLSGAKVIYPGTIRPEALFYSMREVHPSVFVAVPQIYYMIYQNILGHFDKWHPFAYAFLKSVINVCYRLRRWTGLNLAPLLLRRLHHRFGKSLRLLVTGGAKMDEETEEGLFRLGFTVIEGYGLTETSPVLTINPLRKPKIGSAGTALDGVTIKIQKNDSGATGEVWAKGPNIMQGYYRRDDLTRSVMEDGWFKTGDLGYFDRSGYLHITGRAKEVIVLSSGLNIYPEEIENMYLKHVPIKEICIFDIIARKGFKESIVLWAVVVPDLDFFKKYGEVNLKSVIKERIDNVSRMLPASKRIMGFTISLEGLPRTLLGKVKRFQVKETYTAEILKEKEEKASSREMSREDREMMELPVASKIVGFLKKQAKIEKTVHPHDLLELDLGIDSLGRVELASELEKLFGITIDDQIIGGAFTVKDLIIGIAPLVPEKDGASSIEVRHVIDQSDYWKRLLEEFPNEENLSKIDLKPGFGAWLFGSFLIWPIYLFFKIFYRLIIEGRENIPSSGPYILYANHASFYDGFVVAASLSKRPHLDLFFLGFRPYFDVPIIRNLVRIGRIIPLDFSAHLLESLRGCYYILKNNKCLCLFPEGLRTLEGKIVDFKKGFGILVKESGVKIVPVYLDGVYEAWPRTSKFPKLSRMRVKYGKALRSEELIAQGRLLGARDDYEAVCLAAKKALVRLEKEPK